MDMQSASAGWASYLPLLIVVGLLALRFRTMQQARLMLLPMLWFLPLFVSAAVCLAIAAVLPTVLGWGIMAGASMIGAAIASRYAAKLPLKVQGRGADTRVEIKQTPLALVIILATFVLRGMLAPAGISNQTMPMLLTDAALGVVWGSVVAARFTLWKRAKALSQSV